jgi:hypothetical protein
MLKKIGLPTVIFGAERYTGFFRMRTFTNRSLKNASNRLKYIHFAHGW